jgi:hypothetical protein
VAEKRSPNNGLGQQSPVAPMWGTGEAGPSNPKCRTTRPGTKVPDRFERHGRYTWNITSTNNERFMRNLRFTPQHCSPQRAMKLIDLGVWVTYPRLNTPRGGSVVETVGILGLDRYNSRTIARRSHGCIASETTHKVAMRIDNIVDIGRNSVRYESSKHLSDIHPGRRRTPGRICGWGLHGGRPNAVL